MKVPTSTTPVFVEKSNQSRWFIDSWREKPISQEIVYPDPLSVEMVTSQIRSLPGLVSPESIEDARAQLEEVAMGQAFVIQGGDCAESFDDVRGDIIRLKRNLLHQQRQVLEDCFQKPIIEIGRIAGQYAKPRSQNIEVLPDGSAVIPFKGHNINSTHTHLRIPDPRLLLVGYHLAATSLELIRMIESESSVSNLSALRAAKRTTASRSLYTSHEALNLHLEAASTKGVYNTSAEFLWIGERTRAVDGAHVEYMRGLRNPIGVKVGPTASPTELVQLLNILNPRKEIGKITLITRLGSTRVEEVLPGLIRAVKASGHLPVWMCDPCHGNTFSAHCGRKTRLVGTLLSEIKSTYMIHRHCNSHLGGLHLEQTGEDVTECLDKIATNMPDTFVRYKSLCDPRLSVNQAMKIVEEFAGFVKEIDRLSHHQSYTNTVELSTKLDDNVQSSVVEVLS